MYDIMGLDRRKEGGREKVCWMKSELKGMKGMKGLVLEFDSGVCCV